MPVRAATINDFSAIHQLAELLHEKQIDETLLHPQVERLLAEPNRTILVAVDDSDKILGLVVLNLAYKLPKNECRLDEVVVSKAARGRGLGKELLEAAEAWAWERGTDVIELTSRPSREAANTLYRSSGYKLRATNVYEKKRSN